MGMIEYLILEIAVVVGCAPIEAFVITVISKFLALIEIISEGFMEMIIHGDTLETFKFRTHLVF